MESTNARQGYRFDEFVVDTAQRTLQRRGTPVQLPSRAFDALVYLIEHRDRCVGKDEIISAIWHDVVVTDDSLIHAIGVLRRALRDGRQQPRFIRTVPRRGYRFVAAVDTDGASGPRPADTDAATPDALSTTPARLTAGLPKPWLAGLAAAAVAVIAVVWLTGREPDAATSAAAGVQLFQPAPAGTRIVSGGMLSPDGAYLAFAARDEASGETELWVRSLRGSELRRLPGTSGASKPFWSPDSRRIAFFAGGELVTYDPDRDFRMALAPVFAAGGGTWSSDDTILYAEWNTGLFRVPASGDGPAETVAALDRENDDIAIAWPQFFPDNRRFLFQITSLDPDRTGVYVGDLATGRQSRLLETTSSATLAPPHHILHVRNDMLIAEEFDPERIELTGRASVVARGLSEPSLAAENVVSSSADLLAFQHGITRQNLAWHDRHGRQQSVLRLPAPLFNPRLSPDGTQLLGTGAVTTDPGLWLVRLERETYSRLAPDAIGPIWSADGIQVAYTARNGFDLIISTVDVPDVRHVLTSDSTVKILNDWSPDGGDIVFSRHDESTHLDLWRLDVETGATAPLLATPANETQARISPDGNRIAYASDESGRLEVYVAGFPGMNDPQLVSGSGGGQPQWRSDQGELFYLASDRAVTAVEARPDGSFGAPEKLFGAPTAGDPGDARDHFAVDGSGTRFLVDGAINDNDGHAITVVVNWSTGLPD